MNIEDVRKEIMEEYKEMNINYQVLNQLAYLKYLVVSEIENENRCKKLKIPYTPSRRRNLDKELYEDYKREIERNGDKNLLVMVNMDKEKYRTKGIQPFARRYVYPSYGTYHLIHRVKGTTTDLLFREDEVEVVR